jgi:hypothetical protein
MQYGIQWIIAFLALHAAPSNPEMILKQMARVVITATSLH